jgi:hypothetical protein
MKLTIAILTGITFAVFALIAHLHLCPNLP